MSFNEYALTVEKYLNNLIDANIKLRISRDHYTYFLYVDFNAASEDIHFCINLFMYYSESVYPINAANIIKEKLIKDFVTGYLLK